MIRRKKTILGNWREKKKRTRTGKEDGRGGMRRQEENWRRLERGGAEGDFQKRI